MRSISSHAPRVVGISLFALALIALEFAPVNQAVTAGTDKAPVIAPPAALSVINSRTWNGPSDHVRVDSPNFDVRLAKDAASSRYLTSAASRVPSGVLVDLARTRSAGLARIAAGFTAIDVLASPELGTPEVVSARPGFGFLTGPTSDRVGAMRAFLSNYSDAYGLTQEQVDGLELVADYHNPSGNMAWVEFEQRINGLPVFRGLIRGGFTASGQLARTTGPLAAGLEGSSLPVLPSLNAAQAVSRAAASIGWAVNEGTLVQKARDASHVTFARGSMARDAKAWLLYFPVADGVARLAWATEIWGDPDAFLVLLDAEDGTVLFRKNLTNYQSQAATYNVFLTDSPAPMSPTTVLPGSGTQAPFVARSLLTLIGNEAPNTFNNLGWITNGANGANGWTDGNNVEAGIDRNDDDGVDSVVPGANRVFNFPCDPQTDEPLTVSCQNAEVTDTFYWTNAYHDRLYLLGFTEPARNFQNDNFSRGGFGDDRISAESQDIGGTNNANFSTPPDGSRGRMQMYIFPASTPDRTSGFDHDVLLHELTHGTSNRLHNNASGLNTTMSGGLGEGWSDFYARALLSGPDEDPNGIYNTGGWVTHELSSGFHDNYYYGIRRFPYAVKTNVGANGKPHNPLTFADIDQTQINISDGAFAPNPLFQGSSAFQVHKIGELWCMALLEVRARFITRLGFAVGNQRILQFVTDGMKLDPVNPTLLQGRDSIIAAAQAGGGTAVDIADIRAGFATRGMGVTAQVLNASSGRVVETFDATVPANSGRLIGHVRHTGTNTVFENAIVTASPGGRFSITNEDGSYQLYLPVGTYTITASAPDYNDASAAGVLMVDQADTTRDFSLQPSPHLLAQFEEPSKSHVKLADLDGDGKSEIIATTTFSSFFGGGRVHVLSPSGSELPGWPVTLNNRPLNNTPAVGDIDGDGHLDIVVETFGDLSAVPGTDPRKVWAFSMTGATKPGFPLVISSTPLQEGWSTGIFSSGELPSPALADLDGDGVLEIIVISLGSAFGTDGGVVAVFNGDGTLRFKTTLPRSVPPGQFFDEWPHYSVPMIGNLIGDASPEIVVGVSAQHGSGHLTYYALSAQGALLPNWPVTLGPPLANAGFTYEYGALGDLYLDGRDELIITYQASSGAPQRLYVFDGSGQVVTGFPKDLPGNTPVQKFASAPSVADVDHDGFPDIVLLVSDQVNHYLVSYNRFGQQLSQTAITSGSSPDYYYYLRSVGLAEDNNGQVCAVFPVSIGPGANRVQLNAIYLNGQPVAGYPITLPNLCESPFCQASSSVSLGRDSGSSLVYSVLIDQSGNVRRWDIFDSTKPIPWSQFQHDAANTGLARNPQNLTVTRSGTGTGRVSSSFSGINCGATCTAEFNSGTVVALTASADAGSGFTGWTGDCTGLGVCLVTMSQARNVTATFSLTQVQFNAASYGANEIDGVATITVSRLGETFGAASIDYATSDGSASERSDYLATLGTLRFAAGETSKTINVFVVNDAFGEAAETFNLTLSRPFGVGLGSQTLTTVTIDSDESVNGLNPVKEASFNTDFFVRQHYLDFFNREADAPGLAFWKNQIDECTTQACRDIRKINVSAAFFLAIEFQQTGYLVYKANQASFNSGEFLKLRDFLPDLQEIGRGVVIGQPGVDAQLEANKQKFFLDFVQRAPFVAFDAYPTTMTAAEFVDKLNANTFDPLNPGSGGALSSSQRDALVSQLSASPSSASMRAQVLRSVAENSLFNNRQFNRAFVLMQYFGYLRRNPNDPPEIGLDFAGYNFWLSKLNLFNGNFVNAEMVKAFILSSEYQERFGP